MSKRSKIRKIAEGLPRLIRTDKSGARIEVRRKLLGQALINAGRTMLDGIGPVDPKKYYVTNIPDYVDHEKELMDIVGKDGWEGVQKYVDWCYSLTPKTPQENELSETI